MKWTLVTGGASGIGAAISEMLALHHFPLIIHYRNREKEAEKLAEKWRQAGERVEIISGDFSTLDSTTSFIQRYLAAFPETAYLVNNVGNYLIQSGSKTPIQEWQAIFQSNLYSPFLLIQGLLPLLKRARGAVVNLGVAGLMGQRGDKYATAYSSAKAALLHLTRSLALELAPEGVRFNMVSPGYVENSVDLPHQGLSLPMGRAATPMEVAEVVFFLLQENRSYITGQNIEVAGGVRL